MRRTTRERDASSLAVVVMSPSFAEPPNKVARTLCAPAEVAGLRRALDIVRATRDVYKTQQGLSQLTFFVGVMNVFLTAFILGNTPEYYWVWQLLKNVAMSTASYVIKYRNHQRLYLLDLCHVLGFFYIVIAFAGLLASASPHLHAIFAPFTSSKLLFLTAFGIANGPLAWAIPTFGNALVLHSAKHAVALIVHISPPFVTWAMRWHADAHERAFPGVFGVPHANSGDAKRGTSYAESVTTMDLLVPAATLYFAWAGAHILWLLLFGRHKGAKKTAVYGTPRAELVSDTVYHYTMRTVKPFGDVCGYEVARPSKASPILWYMAWHAGGCVGPMVLLGFWWHHYYAHCALLLMTVASCAWHGAGQYAHAMLNQNERKIRALLPDDDEDGAGGGGGGGGKKKK